jgi:isopentenyl-diphosphate delta-isomerase
VTSPLRVSFDDEPLVLVNEADDQIGVATKQRCHDGEGLLHRAFSVFLFSREGDVLLQQRSAQKRLWPRVWSNACCSHPRQGETLSGAVHRRLSEELALEAPVRFLFKFRYHARYDAGGAEHELCHVYAGLLTGRPVVNANEVAATTMMAPDALDRALAARPELYTPWLKLEWARIRAEAWPVVEDILGAPSSRAGVDPPVLGVKRDPGPGSGGGSANGR